MELTENDKIQLQEITDMFKKIDEQLEIEIDKPASHDIPQNYHSIFRLHHQRNRFVYEMLPNLSPLLYKVLRDKRIIDHDLINMWKKNGYENLCCLRSNPAI